MGVDGVLTHDESLSDLHVSQALGHPTQHLHLSRGQSVRIGQLPFQSWRGCSLLSLRGEDVLWRYRPPLSPRDGEGLLTHLDPCASHCWFRRDTRNRWQRSTDDFAQRLRCSPQSCSPCELPLCHGCACQPIQTEDADPRIVRLPEDGQALLVPGTCLHIVALTESEPS